MKDLFLCMETEISKCADHYEWCGTYISNTIFAIIQKTCPEFVSMQNLSPLCLWLCPTSMFEKANPSLKSIFFLSYFKRSIEPECVYAFLLAIQLPSQLIYTWGDHFFAPKADLGKPEVRQASYRERTGVNTRALPCSEGAPRKARGPPGVL